MPKDTQLEEKIDLIHDNFAYAMVTYGAGSPEYKEAKYKAKQAIQELITKARIDELKLTIEKVHLSKSAISYRNNNNYVNERLEKLNNRKGTK